jgi:hypothetical protein
MNQTKYYCLILIALLLAGCDNRKCLSSHTETQFMMMPIWTGNNMTLVPQWYPEQVCDIYENNILPEKKK